MNSAIRHTGLVVSDLDKALHFWNEVLGFTVIKKMEESGPYIDAMMGLNDTRVTTVKLTAPNGGGIELLYFHSHPDGMEWNGKPYSTGFTHVALTVNNLDSTYEKLTDEGVIFNGLPQLSPDGNVKVAYGRGPEGVLLEFVEELSK